MSYENIGGLYVVATPIGNLEDITLRALRTLKEVDLILCEDTRVTRKLLERYQIKKPLLSYHQHSRLKRLDEILEMLKQGKKLALVSDAGTPGISDPGNQLISYLVSQFFGSGTDKLINSRVDQPKIVPIPGPSAITTIASVAGIPMQQFFFAGYPPKKGRRKFFLKIAQSAIPVILFESPYRIKKTLSELTEVLSQSTNHLINQSTRLIVGRELTKQFETIYRGAVKEILRKIEREKPRGEYVVIISRK